jgi:hypothetical protein
VYPLGTLDRWLYWLKTWVSAYEWKKSSDKSLLTLAALRESPLHKFCENSCAIS